MRGAIDSLGAAVGTETMRRSTNKKRLRLAVGVTTAVVLGLSLRRSYATRDPIDPDEIAWG
jgi:hypothetical protein